MGLSIDRSSFSEDEYRHAGVRLRENLAALELLLERPGFGVGEPSLGAELEMSLVDDDFQALPLNREVLADSLDPHLQLELDRFNLEYNLSPVRVAGMPFTSMQYELTAVLDKLESIARHHAGHVVLETGPLRLHVGIFRKVNECRITTLGEQLPTIQETSGGAVKPNPNSSGLPAVARRCVANCRAANASSIQSTRRRMSSG